MVPVAKKLPLETSETEIVEGWNCCARPRPPVDIFLLFLSYFCASWKVFKFSFYTQKLSFEICLKSFDKKSSKEAAGHVGCEEGAVEADSRSSGADWEQSRRGKAIFNQRRAAGSGALFRRRKGNGNRARFEDDSNQPARRIVKIVSQDGQETKHSHIRLTLLLSSKTVFHLETFPSLTFTAASPCVDSIASCMISLCVAFSTFHFIIDLWN